MIMMVEMLVAMMAIIVHDESSMSRGLRSNSSGCDWGVKVDVDVGVL